MRRRAVLLTVVAMVSAYGCTPRNVEIPRGVPSDQVRVEQHGLEVASTTQKEVQEEILSTPTIFDISMEQDEHCWERARFFLENYTGVPSGHSSVMTRIVGNRVSLASNPSFGSYQYEISKDATPEGYTYNVTCQPMQGGDVAQATLNAGNVARFVKDGLLEMSLLRGARAIN